MKALKTVLRILALAALALFLGANLYLSLSYAGGNQLPMPFGYGMAVVLSGSMEGDAPDSLSVDDLVFVKEAEEYAVGDVVVYQRGRSMTVHRIIQMDGKTLVTQGDANNAADEPIDIAIVKGKVVSHISHVGTVVRFLKSPVGVIGVLALALFLMERSYRKEKDQGDEELEKIKEEIRKLKDGQE